MEIVCFTLKLYAAYSYYVMSPKTSANRFYLKIFKLFIQNSYLVTKIIAEKRVVNHLKTLDVAMTGVCAALYTIVGYLTNLGIVTPVVGVVRFWPSVFVPAIFAVLFGPWVGGISAAIGIFFSDMIYPGHGVALLSLTVGVPANFLMFFLIGYIAQKNVNWKHVIVGLGASSLIIGLTAYLTVIELLSVDIFLLFISVLLGCYILIVLLWTRLPKWRSFWIASVVGNGVGCAWIGATLWIYSQFLTLPLTFAPFHRNAPFYAGFLWFVWTFSVQIPFLITIVPPVVKACYRAFPSLKSVEKKG